MRRTVVTFLVVFLVLLFGALVVGSLYFYDLAIKRSPKDFLDDNEDLGAATEAPPVTRVRWDWIDSRLMETWSIVSQDGLQLVAHYLPARQATNKTVILAHGYTGKGLDMEGFARFYRQELGYNVLMPDARGHGESEGDYIGFGWPDRKDYLLWIDKVITTLGVDAQIALHGISMGGATVLMVSGEELPEQVKVIVEDCGYTSVYDQLAYQLERMYHLPPFPIMQTTSLLTKLRVGYSFSEASALKQVAKSTLPILFIHGDQDTFVPTEMVYRLCEACPTEKELYIVKGAGHGVAYNTNRPAYVRKVKDFIGQYMSDK